MTPHCEAGVQLKEAAEVKLRPEVKSQPDQNRAHHALGTEQGRRRCVAMRRGRRGQQQHSLRLVCVVGSAIDQDIITRHEKSTRRENEITRRKEVAARERATSRNLDAVVLGQVASLVADSLNEAKVH